MRFEPIDTRRNLLGEGPFWDEESQRLTLVDIIGKLVLEYDADGTIQIQFTTVRPGNYTWSVPDLADKGLKGTITVK